MKKSLLTIALAVAAVPMMFAKSQEPPAANSTGSANKPAVVSSKKHTTKKAVKKATPKTATKTPAASVNPAASVAKVTPKTAVNKPAVAPKPVSK